jgi:glycosyltransferase involved in cell wall biosynthesis
MVLSKEPLVSVVTPVYNGGAYLAECIESVLAQTFSNWEYVIVNNASTDKTLEIAERYAQFDKRIRVYSNATLLPIIANHNHAFSLISRASTYCKVVSADDWLFPECLSRMVGLAEMNPAVGIVGSYQLCGGGTDWFVRNNGLPLAKEVTSGAEICRKQLMGELSVLGNPTSVLYRADLVRRAEKLYPNSSAEADLSACLAALQCSDFGFVHQVLSRERIHEVRQTTLSQNNNAYLPSNLSDLIEYGRHYLSAEELEYRRHQLMGEYYNYLSTSALKFRDKKFWNYHRQRLKDLGYPLSSARIGAGVARLILNAILNPGRSVETIFRHAWPVIGNLRWLGQASQSSAGERTSERRHAN